MTTLGFPRARGTGQAFAVLVVALAIMTGDCSADRGARKEVSPGETLYNEGKYAEALPLLLKTRQPGQPTGTLLYQIGFCRAQVEGKMDARQEAWEQAAPLLEKEVAAPGGATLERLYYLVVLKYEAGDLEAMRKFGEQAVREIEKGPNANGLSGEDWFRLARIRDFLREPADAEAAYRRAVSAFTKKRGDNPAYQTLALVRVADLDREGHHYEEAVTGYGEALKLNPATDQVKPYRYGLALLATGRWEEAVARFGQDRDPVTSTESQYAADLARKAKDVAPLDTKDRDATPIPQITPEDLVDRIRQAAADLRSARQKNSYKPGDTLTAELVHHQRRFVSLMREQALRDEKLQEFCLRENIADLVRR
jgi:tetratricopeptide (TPR) repeat protein